MKVLGTRFEDALVYATQAHAGQLRKGTSVPYVAHLLGVASLVLEDGGSEDEAIAALLHDAPEDQGGRERLEEIRTRFGDEVAEIVAHCSDTFETPKPPWRERTDAYLASLESAPPAVLRVSLADKLYNARAILRDLVTDGDKLWNRFNASRDDQLWYYGELARIFRDRAPGSMADELGRVVDALEHASAATSSTQGPALAGELTVLGVDLASKRWRDVGSALVSFTRGAATTWGRCEPGALPWPTEAALAPHALADAIDDYAREKDVVAVSIDGPQGWRDPHGPQSQGVGRACERSARTPGKTGAYGRTYPANQVGWISFSIEVFELLLDRQHVHLVNDPDAIPLSGLPAGEYYLLECFPTVTWRTSGLLPLPGKARRPDTAGFAGELARRWGVPVTATAGHDDLQAVVAALTAAAVLGAREAIPHGEPARVLPATEGVPEHRIEGIIWDARPMP